MKRIISVLLTSILLLTAICVPAYAEEAPSDNINSHLTIHYDFSGSDNETKLKDKATAGASADHMTFGVGTASGFAMEEDGVATTVWNQRTSMKAACNADVLEANSGTGVWFVRAKFSALSGNATLIDFRNTNADGNRCFYLAFSTAGEIIVNANSGAAPSGYQTADLKVATSYDFSTSPWINIAAVRTVVDLDGVDYYYYTVYFSMGNEPLQYSNNRFKIGKTSDGLASPAGIELGIFQQACQNWPLTPNYTVDDVRYYNTDLTADQLQTVVADVVSTPAPTPPTEDTTVPPADTAEPPADSSESEEASTEAETPEIVDPGTGGTPTVPTGTAEDPSETTAPEANTQAPATTDSDTQAPADDTAGCGASVGGAALGLLLLVGTAFLPASKKH